MGVYNNKNNLGLSITDKNFVMRVITLILAAVTAVVIFVKPQGAAAAQKKIETGRRRREYEPEKWCSYRKRKRCDVGYSQPDSVQKE